MFDTNILEHTQDPLSEYLEDMKLEESSNGLSEYQILSQQMKTLEKRLIERTSMVLKNTDMIEEYK